ncbi:MAG: hypothetical protein IJJ71_13370 [Treponema sp.]|uniref:hypothetical protein n=1 Tax=Treponema sp. TaxID=166 RepID=UPI0025D8ECD9|nr:hypothetical protein [Treponema sp.]MBQ6057297.1 hypothetical protein [Treponema sp.]MBR0497147.1 hypothetical protein [Treponema sp.]
MNYYLLSTYAVFSKLYDAKKSIYELLAHYVVTFIEERKKYDFVLSSFVFEFNEFYGFNLPQAVLKKVLSRTAGVTFENKLERYYINFKELPDSKIADFNEYKKETDEILCNLINFVQKNEKSELSKKDKELLYKDFSEYLLKSNCKNEKNLKFITAFLIENEENKDYKRTLSAVKEGIIIYSGITTSLISDNAINDVRGAWNTKLTIYLDMEILFHLYGYNGLYFKQLAEDFIKLVKEINKTGQFIELKYFSEIEKEINDYFYAAEKNIENGKLISTSTAMSNIVENCKTPSDILLKKQQFLTFLKDFQIGKDENEYYTEVNFKYNIEGGEFEIHHYLNYINILRKGNNSENLRNIKYILVTGKSEILKQSWNTTIYNDGDIPRATSLDYLTEHFWFLLNKGFGKTKLLNSFDVFNKARIVFSSLISANISDKYQELTEKFADGEVTEALVAETVADLRLQNRKPEDIKANEVDFLLNVLSEDSVNSIICDNEIRKAEYEKTKETLGEKEKEIEELKKYKEIVLKQQKRKNAVKTVISICKNVLKRLFPSIFAILLAFVVSYISVEKFSKHYNKIALFFSCLGLFNIKNIIDFIKCLRGK